MDQQSEFGLEVGLQGIAPSPATGQDVTAVAVADRRLMLLYLVF
jgi:hypothetical protein